MSTHNIGFYEEMAKVIFELSSNTHFICSSGLEQWVQRWMVLVVNFFVFWKFFFFSLLLLCLT